MNPDLQILEGTEGEKIAQEFINRYEAAQPNSPSRSYIPALVRDSRHDANSWSRWEMTRKIRYFDRNVWLVQALREEHAKWTVGPNGLGIQAASSDDEWNKRMNEAYAEFCENPCLDSTITMPQVHRIIAGTSHIENDLFILKTFRKEDGRPSYPAIQLIESHRCSSPGQTYSAQVDGDRVDGVQLRKDEAGRLMGPIGYWILDGLLGDSWTFKSTAEMIHLFDPERAGMFRGITPYHAVMNSLHDLDDLEMMEMQRAKQNSEVANIITSASGELDLDAARGRRFAGGIATTPIDSRNDDINKRVETYRRILGSRTIALKMNEKFEQVGSESPSASTQWYWMYKIGQVCRAAGVPLIAIFPELSQGLQGTLVRGIYDNAHEGFRGKFCLYASAAIKVWRYFAQWARHNDKRCLDAPADWRKCHVTAPRAINVDIGYTSAAMLAELEAGVTNYDDIAAKYGTTALELLRKKAKNMAMIQEIAAEFKIEPSMIAAPIAKVLASLAQAKAVEEMAEKSEGEGKKKEKE